MEYQIPVHPHILIRSFAIQDQCTCIKKRTKEICFHNSNNVGKQPVAWKENYAKYW